MKKTKEEVREYKRLYYHAHKEEYNKLRNEKNKQNRTKLNALSKEYYSNNKEYVLNRNKKYRDENQEQVKRISKIWYENNKEKDKVNSYKWKSNNKEKVKQINQKSSKKHYDNNREKCIQISKDYYALNKEKIRARKRLYDKNKKENDIIYKLKALTRTMIYRSFRGKGYKKESNTFKILGCTCDEFKIYLESKFEPWMNWKNKGLYNGEFNHGWDVDHIIPLNTATSKDELILLNHYTNLQPLCSKINRDIKRNKTEFI